MSTPTSSSALSLHDGRPFFEKALAYGLQHGIIDAAKLEAIGTEAPKGIVQIARYFGTEYLRPELEKARERIVNLVSLYLEDSTDGDLHQAAQSLREHSFLSRSKGGSDMLKRLIAMPESSHFGMYGIADAETPLLALWSLRSHTEYRAELARRSQLAQAIKAALWLAKPFELDADDLEEAGADAESVIRTGLLIHALAPQSTEWPNAVAFEKLFLALRKKKTAAPVLALPLHLPEPLREVCESLRQSVLADLPKLLDPAQALRPLLRANAAFRGRYFLVDDPLGELDHYHHALAEEEEPPQPASKTWIKLTQGHDDEHSLLTLFLCLATGAPRKTLLTEKTAASLVRKIRKSGLQPELAHDFIGSHAPGAFQEDYRRMWASFVQESEKTLRSDLDYQLHDAMALLRRECHVSA
ncbi:hypothetical protein AAFF27_15875 [Xylophilus sp. GW821-FHT01B05]